MFRSTGGKSPVFFQFGCLGPHSGILFFTSHSLQRRFPRSRRISKSLSRVYETRVLLLLAVAGGDWPGRDWVLNRSAETAP